MRGFKAFGSADRFCQAFDEVRNFLRPTSYLNPGSFSSHYYC
jgi:hypothetical protein